MDVCEIVELIDIVEFVVLKLNGSSYCDASFVRGKFRFICLCFFDIFGYLKGRLITIVNFHL